MFCAHCGVQIQLETATFCHACGIPLVKLEERSGGPQKRALKLTKDMPSSSTSTSTSSVRADNMKSLPSFQEFREKKERERSTRFVKKPKLSAPKKDRNTEVTIQIGLLKYRDGELKTVRGSNLPLKVDSGIGCEELSRKAAEKMIKFNKDLPKFTDAFMLLYPDRSAVNNLPGSEVTFTLQKYKEELGKTFQRIVLYLCMKTEFNESVFQECMSHFDDSDTDTESEVVVENQRPSGQEMKKLQIEEIIDITQCEKKTTKTKEHKKYKDDQFKECAICLEYMEDGEVSPQNCDDKFHNVCLTEWLNTSGGCGAKCPTCSVMFSSVKYTSEKPNSEPNKFEDFGLESNSSATQKDKDEGSSTLVEPESVDINSFYSSLFFSEVDFYPDSDLEERDLEKPKEKGSESKPVSLNDILTDLSRQIDSEHTSYFNICRSDMWEGAKRGLKRKSFSPYNKISVKFSDDSGSSEGAIDAGGPTREFFTLIMEWMGSSHLFCGPVEGKFLALNARCVENSEYLYAGKMIALSLVHGGPGINCFSPVLYNALVKRLETTSASVYDVYDHKLKSSLSQLMDAESAKEASEIISKYKLNTILELAGCPHTFESVNDIKAVVNKIAHWYTLGRVYVAIEQLKEGLSVLGVLESMKSHPSVFSKVFQYRPLNVSKETITEIVSVLLSEEGSSKRHIENQIMSYWGDFVQDIEEGETQISFEDLFFFCTGCKKPPPIGSHISIAFLHNPETNGELSKFPKANTCSCILSLPVVYDSYDSFKDSMTFAIANSKGFGYA